MGPAEETELEDDDAVQSQFKQSVAFRLGAETSYCLHHVRVRGRLQSCFGLQRKYRVGEFETLQNAFR